MSVFQAATLCLPEISSLNRGFKGPENGVTFFKLLVLDILDFYGKDWIGKQIDSVAETLFSEYYYWTLAEAKHFISKLKAGHFQESIENISSNYITKAAGTYDAELLEARKLIHDKKVEIKEKEGHGEWVDPEKVFETVGEFTKKLRDNIEKEQIVLESSYKEQREALQEKQHDEMVAYLNNPVHMDLFIKRCEDNGEDYRKILEQLGL